MRKYWILVIMLIISGSRLFAQQVNVPFTITDGFDTDTLRFGLDPTATDYIDAGLNESELPPLPPTGIFDSRFISDISIGIDIGEGLLNDFRNGTSTTSGVRLHKIKYKTGSGTSIRINFWYIPPGISINLMDLFGGIIVNSTFTGSGSLLLTNLAIDVLNFTVTYTLAPPPSTVNIKLIMEGFYNTGGNRLNSKDTCKVYLRQISSPYSIVDSSKAIIDSLTYNGAFVFSNAPTGVYFLAVKHRNSIETWSKTGGVTFTQGTTMAYDFTTSASQAYGNNLKLKGSKYCIYSGDSNQDGVINNSDKNLIVSKLGSGGYIPEDLTGNGFVNATDRSLSVINSGKSKITP